ncbi:MAG: replication protein, partial [Cetobacterium sp.]
WSFIVYPDSAPKNWVEIIQEERVPFVVSPIHDSDVNELTGELKKAHFHVLITYSSVKTFEQVKELTDSLKSTIPQKCKSVKGSVRYMAHLDNPDKAQYEIKDIVGYNGFDVMAQIRTATDRYVMISEMADYIESNDIIEFADLFNYARLNRFDDWFPLLCDNSAFIMGQFIKSKRHRLSKE